MMKWLQERIELEKEERKAKRQEEAQHQEMQRMQHEEIIQALHQTQQQIGMQMKLSEQYIQQQLQQRAATTTAASSRTKLFATANDFSHATATTANKSVSKPFG